MQLDKIACAHSHHFKTQSCGKGTLNDLNGFYGVQPLFKRTLLTKVRTHTSPEIGVGAGQIAATELDLKTHILNTSKDGDKKEGWDRLGESAIHSSIL